jgi:hypothetical protein
MTLTMVQAAASLYKPQSDRVSARESLPRSRSHD